MRISPVTSRKKPRMLTGVEEGIATRMQPAAMITSERVMSVAECTLLNSFSIFSDFSVVFDFFFGFCRI